MATKDPSPGLLSKMVKFVRHPTKDWSELDQIPSEPEKGYSKQALKEMIERKRQNDFIRAREFDQLRKLRRSIPVLNSDQNGRPSVFQASTTATNLDERAKTIQKIDEIEAQMSKQWWKGKQDHAAAGASSPAVLPPAARSERDQPALSDALTQASSAYANTLPPDPAPDSRSADASMFAPTRPAMAMPAGPVARAHVQPMMEFGNLGGAAIEPANSSFSSSKLLSIELGDPQADPDLEEAAIRFANGDNAGAEAGLLAALRSETARSESAKSWIAALFDIYRACGQQDRIEPIAIEYTQRFGQAAPACLAGPNRAGQPAMPPRVESAATLAAASQPIWVCPAVLDSAALRTLHASFLGVSGPWHLNWCGLLSITPDAAPTLAKWFANWCAQPVKLHFAGTEVLEKTLKSCTPSGDKQVERFWWHLRLEALRIMGLQDEFELAALDYCVTYEVSPPPWEDARCEFVSASPPDGTGTGMAGDALRDTVLEAPASWVHAQTEPIGLDTMPAAAVELTGELLGDVAQTLDRLMAGVHGLARLVISCDRLIRVDFSAAGSILNWVAARESEGCHVQFRDVPCLIATFFNVIGINEHARVLWRNS